MTEMTWRERVLAALAVLLVSFSIGYVAAMAAMGNWRPTAVFILTFVFFACLFRIRR